MECLICHREFKALTNTHLAKHGITPKEYEDKFGSRTVPDGWSVKEHNAFYGKKHEKGKSKAKSKEYRDNARNRRLGKKCSEYLVNVSEKEHRKNLSDSHIGEKNSMYGYRYDDERKKLYSEIFSGENNPNWRGGLTKEGYPHIFNEDLKEVIRDRENRSCFICNRSEKDLRRKLDIHHINYNKIDCSHENLVALCHDCHITTNYGNRDYWTYFFSILINSKYGNQQQSSSNVDDGVDENVQRLTDKEPQLISLTRVPDILF